jgi:hypothetical protein
MELLKAAGSYALGRLKEASTWASVAVLAETQLHISLNADFKTAAINLGVSATALAGVLIKEGWAKK